jgi:HPt (histidine-containing phosphotransfer) domain-containing protein
MNHEINSIIESAANLRNSITEVYVESIQRQIERNKEFQQSITKQLNDNENHRLHREDSTQR